MGEFEIAYPIRRKNRWSAPRCRGGANSTCCSSSALLAVQDAQ